ncbi:fungal-specific transcription factor domain-containing protein [Aspergillus karnatakaensis]|uniref:fungal specific transcription factor domain-containing protein n=1 Tax=Aspergillus karnatakaensis TaxID=1810916 RepID=UPI003CCD401B
MAHSIFQEATTIFFHHYHAKPYTLFHPPTFHRKATLNQIPQYLQLAFIATAVRFSSQLQWKQRKQKTIDSYAQCSWEMIMSSPDGLGDSSDVSVVQALALLAIIDATAGRRRAAWVKIGMAVRISQDLGMMVEAENTGLTGEEREERRGLFWSLFLLDRFVCCSFRRPPAIKVEDTRLMLPVDRALKPKESAMTVGELLDEKVRGLPDRVVGLSGLSVGIAALLGRTIDCMMNGEPKTVEPWRVNSDYSNIYTSLEDLKEMADQHSPSSRSPERETNIQLPHGDRTSHFVLSLTLYHLTHCILSHPFLLGMRIQSYPFTPTAWVDAQYASCWGHAQALTTLVVDAKAAGYMLAPSFYSYCVLVAGTVHAILLHSKDKPASERASKYLKTSLKYLSEMSEMWQNSYIMSDALRFFTNRCVRYSGILLGPASKFQELTETDITVLRSVLDYWSMMDPRNPVSELSSINIDCFAKTPEEKEEPVLSSGSDTPGSLKSREENYTVDPGVLSDLPLTAGSPIIEDEGPMEMGEFAKWDWNSELDLMGDGERASL